jgi:hypothetical protein
MCSYPFTIIFIIFGESKVGVLFNYNRSSLFINIDIIDNEIDNNLISIQLYKNVLFFYTLLVIDR